MKRNFLFLLAVLVVKLNAQNLIPNPGFEVFTTCPYTQAQVGFASPWFIPSLGTSDYYHACSSLSSLVNIPGPNQIGYSSSYAHTGSGMAGLYHCSNVKYDMSLPSGESGYREYLAVRLNSTLINNTTYYVSFYAKLADSCIYAGNVSMFISKDSIYKNNFDTIVGPPQINNVSNFFITSKSLWTKISGSFVANGTEKFIYLGNFKPKITNDTFFVGPGGRAPDGYPLGLKLNGAYYYIDDVCLSASVNYCDLWTDLDELTIESIKIVPNPVVGIMRITSGNLNIIALELINFQGERMPLYRNITEKEFDLDCSSLPTGLYFLKIVTDGRTIYKRFMKN